MKYLKKLICGKFDNLFVFFDVKILDSNPHLFFHLQQLRMIEMIRNKQSEEALHFAREELVPQGEENVSLILCPFCKSITTFFLCPSLVNFQPSFLEELEKTVTLLAFEDAEGSPLGYLMNASQRNKTASEINAAILESQNKQKGTSTLYSTFLKVSVFLSFHFRIQTSCSSQTVAMVTESIGTSIVFSSN